MNFPSHWGESPAAFHDYFDFEFGRIDPRTKKTPASLTRSRATVESPKASVRTRTPPVAVPSRQTPVTRLHSGQSSREVTRLPDPSLPSKRPRVDDLYASQGNSRPRTRSQPSSKKPRMKPRTTTSSATSSTLPFLEDLEDTFDYEYVYSDYDYFHRTPQSSKPRGRSTTKPLPKQTTPYLEPKPTRGPTKQSRPHPKYHEPRHNVKPTKAPRPPSPKAPSRQRFSTSSEPPSTMTTSQFTSTMREAPSSPRSTPRKDEDVYEYYYDEDYEDTPPKNVKVMTRPHPTNPDYEYVYYYDYDSDDYRSGSQVEKSPPKAKSPVPLRPSPNVPSNNLAPKRPHQPRIQRPPVPPKRPSRPERRPSLPIPIPTQNSYREPIKPSTEFTTHDTSKMMSYSPMPRRPTYQSTEKTYMPSFSTGLYDYDTTEDYETMETTTRSTTTRRTTMSTTRRSTTTTTRVTTITTTTTTKSTAFLYKRPSQYSEIGTNGFNPCHHGLFCDASDRNYPL